MNTHGLARVTLAGLRYGARAAAQDRFRRRRRAVTGARHRRQRRDLPAARRRTAAHAAVLARRRSSKSGSRRTTPASPERFKARGRRSITLGADSRPADIARRPFRVGHDAIRPVGRRRFASGGRHLRQRRFLHVPRGVQPWRGRLLLPRRRGRGCPVAAPSSAHASGSGRWAAATSAARRLIVDGDPVDVIGVTPPGFFGVAVGDSFDIAGPLLPAARRCVATFRRDRHGTPQARLDGRARVGAPRLAERGRSPPPRSRATPTDEFERYRRSAWPPTRPPPA